MNDHQNPLKSSIEELTENQPLTEETMTSQTEKNIENLSPSVSDQPSLEPNFPEITEDHQPPDLEAETGLDSSLEPDLDPNLETENELVTSEANQELEKAIGLLQQEISTLKQQLDEKSKLVDNFKSQYTRIVADFDNFRKRTLKEKEATELQIKRSTISELLSVVDNFERARTQIKPANDGEMAIHKSYQGVYKNLVESLKRLGVSAMRAEGEPFDPNYHEAILQEETNEYPEGAVIEQLERGYLLDEIVLRHAKVKVATAKSTTDPDSETSSESVNLDTTDY